MEWQLSYETGELTELTKKNDLTGGPGNQGGGCTKVNLPTWLGVGGQQYVGVPDPSSGDLLQVILDVSGKSVRKTEVVVKFDPGQMVRLHAKLVHFHASLCVPWL